MNWQGLAVVNVAMFGLIVALVVDGVREARRERRRRPAVEAWLRQEAAYSRAHPLRPPTVVMMVQSPDRDMGVFDGWTL